MCSPICPCLDPCSPSNEHLWTTCKHSFHQACETNQSDIGGACSRVPSRGVNKRKLCKLDEYFLPHSTKKPKVGTEENGVSLTMELSNKGESLSELFLMPRSQNFAWISIEPQPCVAIIGTAGRKNETWNSLLSLPLFNAMIKAAHEAIVSFGLDPSQCRLISGGAAWSGTLYSNPRVLSCFVRELCV